MFRSGNRTLSVFPSTTVPDANRARCSTPYHFIQQNPFKSAPDSFPCLRRPPPAHRTSAEQEGLSPVFVDVVCLP